MKTSFAILGSGPTLALYQGEEDVAIAVNGASLCSFPYHYFLCGDLESPKRSWFYASTKHAATRIIASFLAPFDIVLYSRAERDLLRRELRPDLCKAKEKLSFLPLYEYNPSIEPLKPHQVFQYSSTGFPTTKKEFLHTLAGFRFVPGATVASIAVQLAFQRGAKEIHIYGCSMDNESGTNYFLRSKSKGKTTPLQIRKFGKLIEWLRGAGSKVIIHGPSKLSERLLDPSKLQHKAPSHMGKITMK